MSELVNFFTGVDIGTSRIVCARPNGSEYVTKSALNAYIQVRDTPAARQALAARRIAYVATPGILEIDGGASVQFAQVYNADLQRTMRLGCLNNQDRSALSVLTRLTAGLVEQAQYSDSVLGFSVPSAPAGTRQGQAIPVLMHHRGLLKRMFEELGYKPIAIQEGEAVIYSELAHTGYTGIGISFGAGLVNVALNYLALPVMAFSLERGGDFIDASSAEVTGEKAVRMRLMKETSFALTGENRDPATRAMHFFYLDLIEFVVDGLIDVLSNSENLAVIENPIPIVIAGGTSMPHGFVNLFERAIRAKGLPLEISEVKAARDPLNAVAIGCLEYVRANHPKS
jgi:hypothetical protein